MARSDDARAEDALSRLLIDLSARGVKVTPDQHFRALSVYLALKASSEPRPNARVATLIGPLVCQSVEDQRIFASVVPLWFPPETPPAEGTDSPVPPLVDRITNTPQDAVRNAEVAAGRVRIRSRILPIAIGLFVCACFIFSYNSFLQVHPTQQRANLPPIVPIAGSRAVGSRSDVGTTAAGAPAASADSHPQNDKPSAAPDPTSAAQPGPFWWQLLACLAPIGVLIGTTALARLAFAQLARMMRVLPDKDMSRLLLASANTLHAGPDFYRLVQPLRSKIAISAAELDIDATIDATVRGGGLSTLVYKQRRVAPEYVVLLDKRCPEDHAARFCELLCSALDQAGVALQQYTFNSDPRRVVPKRGGRALDLRDVAGSSHLIVFSDGFGLAEEHGTSLDELRLVLSNYSRRLLFTWRDPTDWNRREWLLQEQLLFSVFSATEAGLERAAQLLVAEGTHAKLDAGYAHRLGGRDERLDSLLSVPTRWLDNAGPGPAGTTELLRRLKSELGPGTYELLTALAVYPALTWTTSIFVGKNVLGYDALKRGLSRIVGLPWLRVGRMPVWLREALVRDMPTSVRAHVRGALGELLSTATTSGVKDASIEFALGSPAREHVERRDASRDAIVIDVMTRIPGNVTDLPIPTALSRALGLSILSKARRAAFPLGHPNRLAPTFLLLVGGTVITVTASIAAFFLLANRTVVTQVVRAELHARIRSAAFSPNGRCVAAVPEHGDMLVWDATSGQRLATIPDSARSIEPRFSSDGKTLFAASPDDYKKWDARSGRDEGSAAVLDFFDSADRRSVSAQALMPWERHRDWRLASSLDGRTTLLITHNLLLVRNAQLKSSVQIPLSAELVDAEFSPDGSRIVGASRDQTIHLWDPATGTTRTVLTGHQGSISSAIFSADGRRIISASSDETVRVWDIQKRAALVLRANEQEVYAAPLAVDGSRVVTLSDGGTERIWTIEPLAATITDFVHDTMEGGREALSAWRSPSLSAATPDIARCVTSADVAAGASSPVPAAAPAANNGSSRKVPTMAPVGFPTAVAHRRVATPSIGHSPPTATSASSAHSGTPKPVALGQFLIPQKPLTFSPPALHGTTARPDRPRTAASKRAMPSPAPSSDAAFIKKMQEQIDSLLRDSPTPAVVVGSAIRPRPSATAESTAFLSASTALKLRQQMDSLISELASNSPAPTPIGVQPPAELPAQTTPPASAASTAAPIALTSGAPGSPATAAPPGSARQGLEPHLSSIVNSAGAAFASGQNARAVEEYRSVLQKAPTYLAAWVGLGDALAAEFRLDEAETAFRKALQLDPNSVSALDGLGVLDDINGRYREAISYFTDALSLSPTRPDILVNRGKAFNHVGDVAAAVEDDSTAIKLKPSDAEAYVDRARNYLVLGRFEEARADDTRALEIDPGQSEAYADRGLAIVELGDRGGAMNDFDNAIAADSNNADAYSARGRLYYLLGNDQRALSDLNRALQLAPMNLNALKTRQAVRKRMKDVTGAAADGSAINALTGSSVKTRNMPSPSPTPSY